MEFLNSSEEPKNEKIEALQALEEIGLPVLPYVVLDQTNFRAQL